MPAAKSNSSSRRGGPLRSAGCAARGGTKDTPIPAEGARRGTRRVSPCSPLRSPPSRPRALPRRLRPAAPRPPGRRPRRAAPAPAACAPPRPRRAPPGSAGLRAPTARGAPTGSPAAAPGTLRGDHWLRAPGTGRSERAPAELWSGAGRRCENARLPGALGGRRTEEQPGLRRKFAVTSLRVWESPNPLHAAAVGLCESASTGARSLVLLQVARPTLLPQTRQRLCPGCATRRSLQPGGPCPSGDPRSAWPGH